MIQCRLTETVRPNVSVINFTVVV